MCACVYVYVCACVHVYMCLCTCVCVCMCACEDVCLWGCVHVFVYVRSVSFACLLAIFLLMLFSNKAWKYAKDFLLALVWEHSEAVWTVTNTLDCPGSLVGKRVLKTERECCRVGSLVKKCSENIFLRNKHQPKYESEIQLLWAETSLLENK